MATIYLTGNEPLIRNIARAAFPGYTGRKFALRTAESIDVRSYADGGTWSEFAFVQLTDGGVRAGFQVPTQSPFNRPIAGAESVRLDSAPGLACVEHSHYRGKDMGLVIHVHPTMMAGLLPAPEADLTRDEQVVLRCTGTYKASYGGVSRQQRSGLSEDAWNAAKASLAVKGLVNKAGAITPAGRNAAANLNDQELGIRRW